MQKMNGNLKKSIKKNSLATPNNICPSCFNLFILIQPANYFQKIENSFALSVEKEVSSLYCNESRDLRYFYLKSKQNMIINRERKMSHRAMPLNAIAAVEMVKEVKRDRV